MRFPPRSELAKRTRERFVVTVDLLVGGERVFALGFVRAQITFEQRILVVSLKMALQMILETRTEMK